MVPKPKKKQPETLQEAFEYAGLEYREMYTIKDLAAQAGLPIDVTDSLGSMIEKLMNK